jgi:hypothetical protein
MNPSILLMLIPFVGFSQTREQRLAYDSLMVKGHEAFQVHDYAQAGQFYLDAISAYGDKGFSDDRYKAAQALAQCERKDPAFANLQRLLEKTSHLEYRQLLADTLLVPLHQDPRWSVLLEAVRPEFPEIAARLEEINHLDQDLRKTLGETRNKYGFKSAEVDSLWAKINRLDSLNLLEIREILGKYGWLGPRQVGNRGNATLWLVIQHADLATQEQYLPLMRAAADSGKASCGNLAYLEDRILLRKKQKQWYGSQLYTPYGSDKSLYFSVEDPDNLNARRASMGLPPFSPSIIEEIKKSPEKYWD